MQQLFASGNAAWLHGHLRLLSEAPRVVFLQEWKLLCASFLLTRIALIALGTSGHQKMHPRMGWSYVVEHLPSKQSAVAGGGGGGQRGQRTSGGRRKTHRLGERSRVERNTHTEKVGEKGEGREGRERKRMRKKR